MQFPMPSDPLQRKVLSLEFAQCMRHSIARTIFCFYMAAPFLFPRWFGNYLGKKNFYIWSWLQNVKFAYGAVMFAKLSHEIASLQVWEKIQDVAKSKPESSSGEGWEEPKFILFTYCDTNRLRWSFAPVEYRQMSSFDVCPMHGCNSRRDFCWTDPWRKILRVWNQHVHKKNVRN